MYGPQTEGFNAGTLNKLSEIPGNMIKAFQVIYGIRNRLSGWPMDVHRKKDY